MGLLAGSLLMGGLTFIGAGGHIIGTILGMHAAYTHYKTAREQEALEAQLNAGPQKQWGARTNNGSERNNKMLVFGQVKVWPVRTWDWISEDGQTRKAIYEIGEGEINAVSDVRLDDKDITTLTGCSYTAYLGTAVQTVDSRVEEGTTINACESLANWTGTSLVLSNVCKQGEGSVADQIFVPVGGTEYQTYLTDSPDLGAQDRIRFWFWDNLASTDYTWARFYIEDGSGNISWWSLGVFDASVGEFVNRWNYMNFDLTAPDGNNGSPADLSDVAKMGLNMKPSGVTPYTIKIDYLTSRGPREGVVGGMRYTAYLAITMALSDQLEGDPVVTCVVQGLKCQYWTGAAWAEDAGWTKSQNPVWQIATLLMRTKVRGGLGLASSRINGAAALVTANYGDALVNGVPRFTWNGTIDKKTPGPDAINDILATFRGYFVHCDGQLFLKCEQALALSQTFKNTTTSPLQNDILDDTVSVRINPLRKEVNRVRVWWINPSNNYLPEPASASDIADIEVHGLKTLDLHFYGITRFAQASQIAWYYLNDIRFCKLVVGFSVGINASARQIGDRIAITDDDLGWAGKDLMLISMDCHENDELTLTSKEYYEGLFGDVAGALEPDDWRSTLPSRRDIPPNATNLTLTETHKDLKDGTYLPQILVAWDPPNGYTGALGYRVWCKKTVGGTYEQVYTAEVGRVGSTDTFCYIDSREAATYYVVVQTESPDHVCPAFANCPENNITIAGKVANPSDAAFTANCRWDKDIYLEWERLTDSDKAEFEIRTENANWGTVANMIYQGLATAITIAQPPAPAGAPPLAVTYTYYIKLKDRSGNYSATADDVTVTNAVPDVVAGFAGQSTLRGVIYSWTKQTAVDIRGYKIRTAIGAPPAGAWTEITEVTYPRIMTEAEIATNGGTATIFAEVVAVDIYGQESAAAASASAASEYVEESEVNATLFQVRLSDKADEHTETQLQPIYDGILAAGGVAYGASADWKWVQFKYPVAYNIASVKFWPSANIDIYFGYSTDGVTWTYFRGTAAHVLDTGEKFIEATDEADAQANWVDSENMRQNAGDACCGILPELVNGRWYRFCFKAAAGVTLYEVDPEEAVYAETIIGKYMKLYLGLDILSGLGSTGVTRLTASGLQCYDAGSVQSVSVHADGLTMYDHLGGLKVKLGRIGAGDYALEIYAGAIRVYDSLGNLVLGADGLADTVKTKNIWARDGDGLSLCDDAGNLGAFVKDGGDVGIGTNSPDHKLDIESATAIACRVNTTSTVNEARQILQAGDGTTSARFLYLDLLSNETVPQQWRAGMYGDKNFTIYDFTGAAIRFAIDQATGNVSIGQDLTVSDLATLKALRVGSTATDPGDGNGYIEGDLTVVGDLLAGVWQLEAETTLSAQATAISVATGLAGETDVEYMVIARIKGNINTTTVNYGLQFNGDTGSNYGVGMVNATAGGAGAAGHGAAAAAYIQCCYVTDDADLAFIKGVIYAKRDVTNGPFIRMVSFESGSDLATTNVSHNASGIGLWNNSANEMTRIDLIADTANGLGAGTNFQLWVRRSKP